MKTTFRGAILCALLALAVPAIAPAQSQTSALMALPKADVARLIGSWEVQGIPHVKITYEFQAHKMVMRGNSGLDNGSFETAMDADYRLEKDNDVIWIIATNPRPAPPSAGPEGPMPSITGIHMVSADEAVMAVSATEQFSLVRVH